MSTVVVFGTGLAGTTAALSARAAGVDVVAVAGPPGATALWCGGLDIFGRCASLRDESLPLIDAPQQNPPSLHVEQNLDERLRRVWESRPFHPYRLLGLDASQISQRVKAAVEMLAGNGDPPITIRPGTLVASEAGTLTVTDGGPRTVVGKAGDPLRRDSVWLELPEVLEHTPSRLATALLASALRPSEGLVVAKLDWEFENVHSPITLVQLLDQGPDASETADFVAAFETAIAKSGVGTVLIAPILGRTFQCAAEWCDCLSAATGATVLERSALHEPIFGLRMWTFLQSALRSAGVTVVSGRTTGLHLHGKGNVAKVEIETKTGKTVVEDVAGLVLATGRFTGGGITAQAPLKETVLDLPVYLGGQILRRGAQTVEMLGTRPWSDHPLMTVGVGIDKELRPLGDVGKPTWQNVFVAGRLIGGTNPALDGTGEGIDLVTGSLAGALAAGGGR